MISTINYSELPRRDNIQKISKAISVADAILSQDWQYRYYSYQSKWSDFEEFFEMRDGEGSQMLILFHPKGCVINGMSHEHYPKNKEKLTKGIPEIYGEFIFGESVNSIGTTFCIWTNENGFWQTGELDTFDDGSKELLNIFDGNPQTYFEWAKEYYEEGININNDTLSVIQNIYQGIPLTRSMVFSFVDTLDDWNQLIDDLKEINYPFDFS